MGYDHWEEVFRRQVETKKLSDLNHSVSYLWLLVQDQLVDDLSEDLLSIWLNFSLDADDKIVQLIQCLLLEVDLQRVFLQVFQDSLDQLVSVSADDVSRGLTRRVLAEKVDLHSRL